MAPPLITIVEDYPAVARTAAAVFAEAAAAAIATRGRFVVALSGGSTPHALYRLLAEPVGSPHGPAPIVWPLVHVLWGDERWVPPDHPQSNYRMAREALLDRVGMPSGNIYRIETEHQDHPVEAAAHYERELRRVFGEAGEGVPQLDLALLGLGRDGHTASLFPGSPLLAERRRLVAAEWVRAIQDWRITLTPPAFAAARLVMFLVAGPEKADAVAAALGYAAGPAVPARLVATAARRVRWIMDRAAAARMPRSYPVA